MTPAALKLMAASSAVFNGYVCLTNSLADAELDHTLRQHLALAVARANRSEASAAIQTAIARDAGISEDEIRASQQFQLSDPKTNAVLGFAIELLLWRGQTRPQAVRAVREAGFNDSELAEIVAAVTLGTLVSCFEAVAAGMNDSPKGQ